MIFNFLGKKTGKTKTSETNKEHFKIFQEKKHDNLSLILLIFASTEDTSPIVVIKSCNTFKLIIF